MADKALNPAMVQIEYNLDHPHNEFLYWAVEGAGPHDRHGADGRRSVVACAQGRLGQGAALLALVTPILLHTQTEYPLYHAIALWWALLLLVYVLDAEVEEGLQAWPCQLARVCLSPLVVAALRGHHHSPAGGALHADRHSYRLGGHQVRARRLQGADPAARDRQSHGLVDPVEFDVNSVRLMVGLQANNHAELEAYLDWGQAFVRHTPRANIYANMVIALDALGRKEEARVLRREALVLYPGDPC